MAAVTAALVISLATATAGPPWARPSWPPPKFPDSAYGSLPDNWKELTVKAIKKFFPDTDTEHIYFHGLPHRGAVVENREWVPGIDVLVRVNGKNGFGGRGILLRVSFAHGEVVSVHLGTAHY